MNHLKYLLIGSVTTLGILAAIYGMVMGVIYVIVEVVGMGPSALIIIGLIFITASYNVGEIISERNK